MIMLLQLAVGSMEQVVKTHLANARYRPWLREVAVTLCRLLILYKSAECDKMCYCTMLLEFFQHTTNIVKSVGSAVSRDRRSRGVASPDGSTVSFSA